MKKIIVFLFVLSLTTVPTVLLAQLTSFPPDTPSGGESGIKIENPIKANTLMELLVDILDAALQVALPVVALLIVWSGLKFVLARGKPEEINKAIETFKWTIIGTAVVLGAFVIAQAIRLTVESLAR